MVKPGGGGACGTPGGWRFHWSVGGAGGRGGGEGGLGGGGGGAGKELASRGGGGKGTRALAVRLATHSSRPASSREQLRPAWKEIDAAILTLHNH